MKIDEARTLWEPAGVYCNTASYGLPPRPAWDALANFVEHPMHVVESEAEDYDLRVSE